jgi:hypothetical protein
MWAPTELFYREIRQAAARLQASNMALRLGGQRGIKEEEEKKCRMDK